jgi:MFS family permease
VSLVFFLNGLIVATWVSRIPAVQAQHRLSHAMLGVALFSIALGALVAMPLSGWFSARWGSAIVSRCTALLSPLTLPVIAIAPDLPWLVAELFVLGALNGMLDVAMNAQAVEVEKRFARPIMSSFHALFSLGGLTGATTGGLLIEIGWSPSLHFNVIAAVSVLATAALAAPWLLTAEHDTGIQKPGEVSFVRPGGTLLLLGVLAFCVMLGEGAMADWSAIFLRECTGSTEALAAAGYAAFSLTMTAGRVAGDVLSFRLGPVRLVRYGGWLAALGLAAAITLPFPAVALVGFAAVGAGFATIVPQIFTAAGTLPGTAPGPALATVSTMGYFGFLVGPPVIGFLAEVIGLRMALLAIVAACVVLAAGAASVQKHRAQ